MNLISPSSRLHAAETNLNASQAQRDAAQIRSPIEGIVVDLSAKNAEWAQPGQILVIIANLSEWVITTQELSESDVVEIELEQTAEIRLDIAPETIMQGTIELIDRVPLEVDDEIYYPIRIKLAGEPPIPLWGLTARITIR